MTKRRAHADVIERWMNDSDAVVEQQTATGWRVVSYPDWHEDHVYRIKEREFPKTSYSGEELYLLYFHCEKNSEESMLLVANEVIKRYIQDMEETAQ